MAQTSLGHETEATVHLRVRVPDGASGDLLAGAATVVTRIDALDDVDVEEITGMTPTLNAIVVDVRATVTLRTAAADDSTVRADLADGTGIEAVHEVALANRTAATA